MGSERFGAEERAAGGASNDLGLPPAHRVEKPWGHELIWVVADRYVGKAIHIAAGHRLSLQYHNVKDESIYVIGGRLRLYLEDEAGELRTHELTKGQSARVHVGRRHRFEAIEDVDLIEVSTPELDDVVRLQDDYGREGTTAP